MPVLIASAPRVSVAFRRGAKREHYRWRLACVSPAHGRREKVHENNAAFVVRFPRRAIDHHRAVTRRAASEGTPNASPGESASEAAARLEREALEAQTRIALAETRARLEREKQIVARAEALEAELRRRDEGARAADKIGGRRPTQRKCVPIAFAGVQCALLSVGALMLTRNAASAVSPTAVVERPEPTFLVNVAVGAGAGATCLLVISSLILFLVAFQEGLGVVTNAPVTFYRCDGSGRECCKNGPHNLGYAKKFVYLNNGAGFETRQKDAMARHLRVNPGCRALPPLVIYPKKEGWKLW